MRPPLLELTDVTRSYRAEAPGNRAPVNALAGISLTVAAGECIGIAGGAGAGKSTLLLCAAGLLRPDSGTVSGERTEYVLPCADRDPVSGLGSSLHAALARAPRVLCIDDAVSTRDAAAREQYARLIRQLRREGFGLLVAARDAELLERLALRVVTLCAGRVMHTVRRVPALQLEVRMTRRIVGRVAEGHRPP